MVTDRRTDEHIKTANTALIHSIALVKIGKPHRDTFFDLHSMRYIEQRLYQ